MNDFKGRVVVVTGGTSGIGAGIADGFAAAGARVVVCSRRKAYAGSHDFRTVDVRDRSALRSFADAVVRDRGKLDVWVNAAGISKWRALSAIDEAFMSEIYETNVLGTLWGSQAAAAHLSSGGCILNVSSLAGKRGSANNAAYCASKFAVNGLTQSLAKELGARGIRVNAVCPVYVETDTILSALEGPAAPPAGRPVRAYLDDFARTQTALGRLPTPADVAQAALALASADGVTGQCLNVDCGALPQ